MGLEFIIKNGSHWEATDNLVVTPVFANFRFSPKLGEETRLTLQVGYGIAIGNLAEGLKKLSLGLENSDGIQLFIELSQYSLPLHNQKDFGHIKGFL